MIINEEIGFTSVSMNQKSGLGQTIHFLFPPASTHVLNSGMQDLLMIYSKSESFVLQKLKGVGCAFLFFILNLHQWALKQILILSFRQQLRHRSYATLLTFKKKKGIVFWEDDPSQSLAYELAEKKAFFNI